MKISGFNVLRRVSEIFARLQPTPPVQSIHVVRTCASDDGAVLLSMGNGKMFTTNVTGATIWSAWEKGESEDEIANHLSLSFQIGIDIAKRDVAAFIELCSRSLGTAPQRVSAQREPKVNTLVLTFCAIAHMIRFDCELWCRGSTALIKDIANSRVVKWSASDFAEQAVVEAVSNASCLYWKSIPCFQRSVVLTRLLRKNGIEASLVIGVRACPLAGHAWVEVNGRVVGDSAGYRQRLTVLARL